MSIRILPPERYAQAHVELYGERPRPGASVFVNLDNALGLAEPDVLTYRGRQFRVRPVSAFDGLKLMQLTQRFQQMAEQGAVGMREFRRVYADVLALFARLARPGGWRGWIWRLRPNPFREASAQEIAELSRFFFGMTMRSGVSYRNQMSPGRPSIT